MPDLITNPSEYLKELFGPQDHIAVTLIHKRFDTALKANPGLANFGPRVQRTALAHHFATPKYLAFLRWLNSTGYEVYSTPNTIAPDSHGRKKTDISEIRHLYLDFDEDGEAAVDRLLARCDSIPHPNYIVRTSNGKFQVLWKVTSFDMNTAERLLRALARDTAADIAATDIARVLRLPGFMNNKYLPHKHFVTALCFHRTTFTPAQFPTFPDPLIAARPLLFNPSYKPTTNAPPKSRSEQDMKDALKRLRRFEGPPGVIPDQQIQDAIASLISHRPDKPNPRYYATLTITKAQTIISQSPRTR